MAAPDPVGNPVPALTTTTPRPAAELLGIIFGGVGAAATFLGAIGLILPLGVDWSLAMGLVVAAGLVCTVVSFATAQRLDRLHRFAAFDMGDRTEQLHMAQRLRIASLMLHVLLLLGIAVLAVGFPARYDVFHLPVASGILGRAALALLAVLASLTAYAHYAALHAPPGRGEGKTLLFALLLCLLGILALLAGIAALRDGGDAPDVPLLALAAGVAAGYALVQGRGLPSITAIIGSDRGMAGSPVISRNRAVFLPILAALALLLLVFLLFIVLGLGVVGAFAQVAQDPVVIGVFLFLVVAIGGSLAAAFRLARSEPLEPPLFQVKTDAKKFREALLLGGSGLVAVLLLVPAGVLFLGNDLGGIPSSAWIHFFCLAILVLLGPYGFYAAHEQKRVRLLEERFPDFLRDLASSHKGGLTLTSAIKVSARGDYGPLTPEVQRMADQVSWNVGFQEVLQRFAERVATPLVQRAVTLILQADRSGGSTTEVLLAAARDAREIKTLETERRLAMSLYTVVIYVTFLVFLGVASVLYAQFVPQLVAANQAAAAQSKLASLGQFVGSSLRLADFQLFYLLAAVMQGLGDGIVAGQMGSGKAVLGLRHSFVMVLLSYVCFALFLR